MPSFEKTYCDLYWRTKDGRFIRYGELSTKHALSIKRLLAHKKAPLPKGLFERLESVTSAADTEKSGDA